MSILNDYRLLPFGKFLEDIAAKSPAPGGGSVAASVGALSASLACMAVEFTVGKKKFAAHEERLRQMLNELRRAGEMFGQLIGEDIAAYQRYAAARKSDDEHEQARAMGTATAVPVEIVVVAAAVAARLDEIKGFINPVLFSDVQVGAILAHAAAESAALTVRGNLPYLPDQTEAARLREKLDDLLARTRQHRDAVVTHVPTA